MSEMSRNNGPKGEPKPITPDTLEQLEAIFNNHPSIPERRGSDKQLVGATVATPPETLTAEALPRRDRGELQASVAAKHADQVTDGVSPPSDNLPGSVNGTLRINPRVTPITPSQTRPSIGQNVVADSAQTRAVGKEALHRQSAQRHAQVSGSQLAEDSSSVSSAPSNSSLPLDEFSRLVVASLNSHFKEDAHSSALKSVITALANIFRAHGMKKGGLDTNVLAAEDKELCCGHLLPRTVKGQLESLNADVRDSILNQATKQMLRAGYSLITRENNSTVFLPPEEKHYA